MCHPDRSVAKWRDLLFLFPVRKPSGKKHQEVPGT
jgi:hypothetical protein